MEGWLIGKSASGQTLQVAESVDRLASCFVPVMKEKRYNRKQRKAIERTLPLYPGYFFVRADEATDLRPFRWLVGFHGFVRVGADVISVPTALVDEIRVDSQEGAYDVVLGQPPRKGPNPYHRGDTVRFARGPFATMQALVDKVVGETTIKVLVDGFDKPIRASLDLVEAA